MAEVLLHFREQIWGNPELQNLGVERITARHLLTVQRHSALSYRRRKPQYPSRCDTMLHRFFSGLPRTDSQTPR